MASMQEFNARKKTPSQRETSLPTKDNAPTLKEAWEELDRLLRRTQFDSLGKDTKIANIFRGNLLNLKGILATKITKIVYDKQEDIRAKLTSIYTAMHSSDTPVFILLNNTAAMTEFYIGVNNGDTGEHVSDKMRTLEFSLNGNFPGMEYANGDFQTVQKLYQLLNKDENRALASIVGIPSVKQQDEAGFSQGLEKVIEALGSEEYVALLLATPVQRWELDIVEAGYQELVSTLSIMNISQLNLSQQDSLAIGKALSQSMAKTLTNSIANTDSTTRTKSHTTTHTEGDSVSNTIGINAGVSFILSAGGSLSHTKTHSVSDSISDTIGISQGVSKTLSSSEGTTETKGLTDSITQSKSTGTAITYNVQDRRIVDNLKLLDEQLLRIRNAKNYGAWNWGVYFLGRTPAIVKSCADVFSGILSGEQTGIERCDSFVMWKRQDYRQTDTVFDMAKKSLAFLMHPMFEMQSGEIISPTTLVTTPELAIGMSFPRKSLPSVPVFEVAEFARSVTSLNMNKKQSRAQFNIGKVVHLGKEANIPVNLDVDSLCMHTFVTGSTGSGKSNAVYNLLLNLYKNNDSRKKIPFLVIEPAKGEYKDAFGFLYDVNVFGTNPEKTKLLKINPFSFPEQIHIMEHIDRLIEILNAAWPMYSAMPAILKDAVLKIYEKCGWDLLKSQNRHGYALFPDFNDLIDVLPDVIKSSGYSAEVTSNYMGALCTRVKSLTNGYFKTIFQKDELPSKELFDKSCIVDLSRVGSTETKSLLMGIVFMKLQEYRMANAVQGNQPLKHVTVLEEAHNLLRRTSPEQSMESANLMGKSVEMMTNAIAEMRTYGEGFIIADQAPGLLDQAVIRNTNTKIIFRLPDYQDRLLVGRAENLNDMQIDELARLKTGCASVYQNDWQEAVLCQFEKFDVHKLTERTNPQFTYEKEDSGKPDSRTEAKVRLLQRLIPMRNDMQDNGRKTDEDARLFRMYYPELLEKGKGDDGSSSKLQMKVFSQGQQRTEIENLLNLKAIQNELTAKHVSADRWAEEMLCHALKAPWLDSISEAERLALIPIIFDIIAHHTEPKFQEFWISQGNDIEKWKEVILR